MNIFTRNDGTAIPIVEGFRSKLLAHRPAVSPKLGWSGHDYQLAASIKHRRLQRLIQQFKEYSGGNLRGLYVLDVGCGDGINSLLAARQNPRQVTGIDLHPGLLAQDSKGERARWLAREVLELHEHEDLQAALRMLPLQFHTMDAAAMTFPDECMDWVFSRSVLEHVNNPNKVLNEMIRVLRSNGLIYLSIDPFCWLRGCHKRGVVDIPWAHVRLTPEDYQRFVAWHEGENVAAKRAQRLRTLNGLTLSQWREMIQNLPAEILDWQEDFSSLGAQLLQVLPEVESTLLPGIQKRDLLHERLRIWLRKRA